MTRVYLDESGRPEDPHDIFVVGGLLLDGALGDHIRLRWVTRFPGLPWPLHAAHFRVPASMAYAWVAHGARSGGSRPPWASAAVRAVAAVGRQAVNHHQAVLGLFKQGKWPRRRDYEKLILVDAAMRRHALRGDYDNLASAADEIAAEIRAVVRYVTEGGSPAVGALVASIEEPTGAAARRVAGLPRDIGSRRYLRLLQEAVRTAASLRRPIKPVVMVRNITEGRRERPVSAHDVTGLLHGMRQIEPPLVAAFDRASPPEFVVADFVPNATRRALAGPRRSVRAMLGDLTSEIGAMPAVGWVS